MHEQGIRERQFSAVKGGVWVLSGYLESRLADPLVLPELMDWRVKVGVSGGEMGEVIIMYSICSCCCL